MSNKRRTASTRGRPKTGKKAFCIRLSPGAYTDLCRIAGERSLSLSRWLELMATAKQALPVNGEGDFDDGEAGRRFDFLVRETHSLLITIRELFDLDVAVAKKPQIKALLEDIRGLSTEIFGFMESEGVLRRCR